VSIDHRLFYRERATDYDDLVSAEDADRVLGPALADLIDPRRGPVADVGAGTGRVTRLLEVAGAQVVAVDAAMPMLHVARGRAASTGHPVRWVCADAQALPLRDHAMAAAVSGWAFGHSCEWFPELWPDVIGRFVAEMERVVAPGGVCVVIETLGTGAARPEPPSDALGTYYEWLEREVGMTRRVLRTDFEFTDHEAAARAMAPFFGDAIAARVRAERWSRIPEFTGLWSRRV
jgi:ubiquinone/menaquinone biosynthesis C-methylase UbiE